MRARLFAALCVAALPVASLAEPADFGTETKFGIMTGTPPLPASLEGFVRKFQTEARFFAALAIDFEAEVGYYIQNFHALERAERAAIAGCEALEDAAECQVYAIATSDALPVTDRDPVGLSALASASFNGVYAEKQKPGRYGAYAISGSSHQGYSWNYKTQAQAQQRALDECRLIASNDRADASTDAALTVLEGRYECRIVHEVLPEG